MSQSLTKILINRFNQEGVIYCHWKSNIDLAKTMEGELDLDLLIANHSLAQATEILMQLGFKAASPKWGKLSSGIYHYYAFDSGKDNLVHVHMFSRVLTGESFLKSHLFPFDEMLLKNTDSFDKLPIATKEAELILFVLRMYIKYGSFFDVMRIIKIEKKIQEEARWLIDSCDMKQLFTLLNTYCPAVNDEIFSDCLNALLHNVSIPRKLILSFRMRRSLRIYKKYSFIGRIIGYIQFFAGILIKRIRRQKGSKQLLSGGTVIAIVGADATGKSTLVEETTRWLRKNFVVNAVHAGKPPSTLLTLPINFLLALNRTIKTKAKSLRKSEEISSLEEFDNNASAKNPNSLIYGIRAVSLAWDRRALLLRVRRASAYGEIIICDRYPTSVPGMMDSPRLLNNTTRNSLIGKIYTWLTKLERNIYRQIPPPDIVLRLRVSLEIAKKRNAERETSDDEVYLQNRHQQVKDWSVTGARVIKDIDTDPPLDETIATVKEVIWSYL